MAICYMCDICGRRMPENDEQRYIFKIEIHAAAPVLEITSEDLQRDHSAEMLRLVEQLRRQNPDQIGDAVYRAFQYDLCRACQQKVVADPIATLRRTRRG
jgi:hypothetical protein